MFGYVASFYSPPPWGASIAFPGPAHHHPKPARLLFKVGKVQTPLPPPVGIHPAPLGSGRWLKKNMVVPLLTENVFGPLFLGFPRDPPPTHLDLTPPTPLGRVPAEPPPPRGSKKKPAASPTSPRWLPHSFNRRSSTLRPHSSRLPFSSHPHRNSSPSQPSFLPVPFPIEIPFTNHVISSVTRWKAIYSIKHRWPEEVSAMFLSAE